MKISNVLMITGLCLLLAGAVMSLLKIQPYSDWFLIAGALIIIVRGSVCAREKQDGESQAGGDETENK